MTDDGLQGIRFVGPATADALAAAGIEPAAVCERRVSYRQLTDAGVNPGVAAKLRREHSLPWSFDSREDLDRRSAQIRGLGEAEREWVAASAGEWERATTPEEDGDAEAGDDWTPGGWPDQPDDATADGSGDPAAAELAWRERSAPEPVTTLSGIGDAYADRLGEAGITSVRSLAAANPERVAAALDLSEKRVREWHRAARRHVE